MTTGVTRFKINSIYPGISNCIVVGIIIAKQSPKVVKFKKGKSNKF